MTKNQSTTKYALYCRKSTEDSNRQVLSLDSQEQEMKRLASNLDLNISSVFRESKSAKMPDNRPMFQEMINLIKQGKIEAIICWKIDRLSRNPIDSATVQWLLQQGKLKVIQTMERQYLPSDNALLFNVESGMANQYILDLSKNVKRGIKAKLEQGHWPNLAPIGYLNHNGEVIVDKERVQYIKKAFEMYASSNYTLKEIADTLFKEGFRSRANNKYHKSKIHRILSNSFYCGIMQKDGQKYLGKHKSIISKQLFDKTQEMIYRKAHPKRQVIPFAFRGILKCSVCGCQLTASKKREKHIYYYCTNGKGTCNEHKSYLKEDFLSKELINIFDDLIFSEKLVNLVYQAKLQDSGNKNKYLNDALCSLNNKLLKAKAKKKALLDAYLEKIISEEDYLLSNKDIGNEIADLVKDIEEIKSRKSKEDKATLEQIKNIFLAPKTMKKQFLSLNSDKQRQVLNLLLWNAEVKNKKIANISYKQPYLAMSKIENKSDFNSMRATRVKYRHIAIL